MPASLIIQKTSTAEISSATPLISLSAVFLDTETTGLDVNTARIVQIGAVRATRGSVELENAFDRLINPAEPIPPQTTAIHGLSDADVRDAPDFAAVAPLLADWIAGAIVIGYSIGFDIAILQREHRRAGLDWPPPRTLDVRHMVGILAPNLPDHALETVAGWLDIEIVDRHQALGDAVLTARVFFALLPLLRERGVRTLAEAERASSELSGQAVSEGESGWHDAVQAAKLAQGSLSALARIDSFPYRHRVADVMHSPAMFAAAGDTAKDVLDKLVAGKISSVFVAPDAKSGAAGIITERDILRAIKDDPAKTLQKKAARIAIRPLDTVSQDAFVYRAIARMSRKGYRHLGVHNDAGEIVGALSARDLLKQRADDAISLGDEIADAETAEDLGAVWANLTLVAQGLVSEQVDARDIAAVISRELCALTRHACLIAECEMAAAGRGPPPVAYAMLVLGSGGRGESLLAMDQDNAIVYSHGQPGSPQDKWLEQLGVRVADILHAAGVPYCKGGIMASNAEWRMSVNDWKTAVGQWIRRHSPEDILNTDIFFDAVSVHGDNSLATQVIDTAFEAGRGAREFLQLMSVNAADVRSPFGLFGRFRLQDGRIDLKKSGIMPIFSTARVLAIRHGIRTRSTPERLQAAKAQTTMPISLFDNLIEAHKLLLGAILNQQLADLDAGIPLSNKVAPAEMATVPRQRLKWALQQVSAAANLLGDPLVMT